MKTDSEISAVTVTPSATVANPPVAPTPTRTASTHA